MRMVLRFLLLGSVMGASLSSPAHAVITQCGQPSHVWVATASPFSVQRGSTLTVPANTKIFPTGVVNPNSTIVFVFSDQTAGRPQVVHTTQPARANCVVHHEDEVMDAGADLGVGTWAITANFRPWETSGLSLIQQNVGRLIVNPATTSRGGGGGEPSCPEGQIC